MAIPIDLKQIQKLTRCVAALSTFISRLGEKALPLYRLLRRTEHFEWTDAATAGLEEIKAILATNPILAAPTVGEPMLLYIEATHQVVRQCSSSNERWTDINSHFKSRYIMYPPSSPMQNTVPTLSKDSIRGIDGIPEITTLLSRVFDYGGLRSTTQ